jgi:predicted nucleic acid-binding protein
VILVDSSAWIEFLRGTGSPVHLDVRALLAEDADIAICDPIRMELLAGARSDGDVRDLRRLLGRATLLPLESRHYEDAARLYRVCRRHGETVRKLIDCLIAACALSAVVPVLHRDADFDVLQRHAGLSVASSRG